MQKFIWEEKYLGLSPVEAQIFAGEKMGLLVTHPETHPYRTNIQVSKGINDYLWEKKLDFKMNHLVIKSIPKGANIYLDGELQGKSPISIETSNGEKELELKMKGYLDYTSQVTLKGGKRKVLEPIKLIPAATLSISSIPSGADVFLDGDWKGTTPTKFESNVGKREVVLTVENHSEYKTYINLKQGEQNKLKDIKLIKEKQQFKDLEIELIPSEIELMPSYPKLENHSFYFRFGCRVLYNWFFK